MIFSRTRFKSIKNKRFIKIINFKYILIIFLILSSIFALYYFYVNDKTAPVVYSVSQFDTCYNQIKLKSNNSNAKGQLISCYKGVAHNLLSVENLRNIISQLEMRKNDMILIQDCHTIGHLLGQEEYKKTNNIATSLSECTEYCQSGCYHGVVEQYFQDKYANGGISLTKLQNDINSMCINKDKTCGDIIGDAQHGLGHALMFLTNYNLNKSLTLCGNMDQCYYGVFMESSDVGRNISNKKKDILYPCDTINTKYQFACYNALSTSVFNDVKNSINLCSQFPIQNQRRCYLNVDKNHSVNTKDIVLLKNDCKSIDNVQIKRWCIEGILFDLLSKYNNDYQLSVNFCNIQDKEYRNDCFNSIFTQNYSPYPDVNGIKQICSMIPKDIKLQTCN